MSSDRRSPVHLWVALRRDTGTPGASLPTVHAEEEGLDRGPRGGTDGRGVGISDPKSTNFLLFPPPSFAPLLDVSPTPLPGALALPWSGPHPHGSLGDRSSERGRGSRGRPGGNARKVRLFKTRRLFGRKSFPQPPVLPPEPNPKHPQFRRRRGRRVGPHPPPRSAWRLCGSVGWDGSWTPTPRPLAPAAPSRNTPTGELADASPRAPSGTWPRRHEARQPPNAREAPPTPVVADLPASDVPRDPCRTE